MESVKQKVWNEAENRERDWRETLRACEARALRARKTLTPRFTDFFADFEEKRPTVLQSTFEANLGRCRFLYSSGLLRYEFCESATETVKDST